MAFHFDEKRDSWICDEHGEIGTPAWVPCWACFGEGGQDAYEDDPINYAPGEEWEECDECRGAGGHKVCPICNEDNPDAEF
jgi:DnaJ-class molecular chaperone